MFAIDDKYVSAAYILCLLSSLLCIIYGVFTWNQGKVETTAQEDQNWAQDEKKMEEEL